MAEKPTQELGAMETIDSSNDTFKSAEFGVTDHKEAKQQQSPQDVFESIKDEEFDEEDYRRKTRRRLLIIAASAVILVLVTIGIVVGVVVPKHSKKNPSLSINESEAIKAVCNSTLYPDFCYSSIYSLKSSSETQNPDSKPDSPIQIFMLSLQVALNELVTLRSFISDTLINSFTKNDPSTTQNALNACEYLINDAIDHVDMSMFSAKQQGIDGADDLRTWLSTALTDQETCMKGMTEFNNTSPTNQKDDIKAAMQNATIFTSNSLAIITKISTIIHRKLLQKPDKILEAEDGKLRANFTVAKDGSGDYGSINEAVSDVPRRSNQRFFIYVKEGEYEENVVVDSDTWNLMIYGDGMNKSIVSASLNYVDGVGTFESGTFIAEGRGFIARDIGFKNGAGPKKLQAVAVRASSDQSIYYRCSFDAYQDTLYAHTGRQFYQECLITGTIDFIFGNAAAVFHNCTIQPRQPEPGQYNIVTAQSKSDPNQNTGYSIQQCRISPLGNLTARTFMGRPWNVYSTTVIMETEIQGIIDPAGWTPWDPNVQVPDTIFYAEYKNIGPGSVLNGRVTWPGYRPGITDEEAEKFSTEKFIQGSKWLKGYYKP